MRTIVLNRFPDVIRPLLLSLEKFKLQRSDVIIVRDGHEEQYGYANIPGITPFVFSRNANAGIRLATALDKGLRDPKGPFTDVLLVNDDCEILQEDFFAKLKEVTESLPNTVGILGALVDGGVGNAMQRWPANFTDKLYFVPHPMPVCFVAVWLRGKMLTDIGLLDESFREYGFDDNDMCHRARYKGWSCALSSELWVKHGEGGSENIRGVNWSKSFSRVDPQFARNNMAILRAKYTPKFRVSTYETR